MSEALLIAHCAFLLGILAVGLPLWQRMPPMVGGIERATGGAREAHLLRQPLMRLGIEEAMGLTTQRPAWVGGTGKRNCGWIGASRHLGAASGRSR